MRKMLFALFFTGLWFTGGAVDWKLWPRNLPVSLENGGGKSRATAEKLREGVVYCYLPVVRTGVSEVRLPVVYTGGGENRGSRVTLLFRKEKNGSIGTVTLPWTMTENDASIRALVDIPDGTHSIQLGLQLRDFSGALMLGAPSLTPVELIGTQGRMDGFFTRTGVPERNRTQVTVTRLPDALRFTVRCFVPRGTKLRTLCGRDGEALWTDDSAELFLKGPNNRAYQFILSAAGLRYDGALCRLFPGEPYHCDATWNGSWQSSVRRGDDCWDAIFTIPVKDFDLKFPDGAWTFNAARNDRSGTGPERTRMTIFHGTEDNNLMKFNSLDVAPDGVRIRRYREKIEERPLDIVRKKIFFEEAPSQQSGRYRIDGFNGAFHIKAYFSPKFRERYEKEWPKEQELMMELMARLGTNGAHSFPWVVSVLGGEKRFSELADRYGLTFRFYSHQAVMDRAAIAAGTARFHANKRVDAADPALERENRKQVAAYFAAKPHYQRYISFLFGTDEPTNYLNDAYSTLHNPGNKKAMDELDELIRKRYGYGKFGRYDVYEREDASSPFRRIAFYRYWNDGYFRYKKEEQVDFARRFPGVAYISTVVNAVETDRGIVDISLIGTVSDYVGVDPYPTATLNARGRDRALYHTGFATQFTRDLSGRQAYVYVQAFRYRNITPTPGLLREWLAQAVKSGGTFFAFYCDRIQEDSPELYVEMIRLTSRLGAMKPLALPRDSRIGVLHSNVSAWGGMERGQHGAYTLYTLFGEKTNRFVRFVSDTQIQQQGEKAFQKLKVLFVPYWTYADPECVKRVAAFVRGGGTLVLLDPAAGRFAPDGSEPWLWAKEFGFVPGAPRHDRVMIAETGFPGVEPATSLPLAPVADRLGSGNTDCFSVRPPQGAQVIARYQDATPAAFYLKSGQGKVFYFAGQPFGDSRFVSADTPWNAFIEAIGKQAGEPVHPKLWNFGFPEKGGLTRFKTIIREVRDAQKN